MKSNSSHWIGDVLYVKWDLHSTCADPETIVRGGPTLTTFFVFVFVFFLVERRDDPNATRSGPSSARQRKAIFKRRFAGVPMMAQH